MADGTVIGLAITTFSSMALGGGALWRSYRQDRDQADQQKSAAEQVRTDAAVAALGKQVDLLLTQADGHLRSESAMRQEMDTERKERAAAEERLRQEHAAAQARLYARIRDLEVAIERCNTDRIDLMRQLAAASGPQPTEEETREAPSP